MQPGDVLVAFAVCFLYSWAHGICCGNKFGPGVLMIVGQTLFEQCSQSDSCQCQLTIDGPNIPAVVGLVEVPALVEPDLVSQM